jgi:hypothetical protein
MPLMGFETTIPAFEGAKTVHAVLDHTATLIAMRSSTRVKSAPVTLKQLQIPHDQTGVEPGLWRSEAGD